MDNAAREGHERIWLQYKDEDGEPNDYNEGVTWCQDQVNDTDIEYIRADIAALASNQPVKLYNKPGETLQSIDDAEGRN